MKGLIIRSFLSLRAVLTALVVLAAPSVFAQKAGGNYPQVSTGTVLSNSGGLRTVASTQPTLSFTTSCTGGTLTHATTYYYRVSAVNLAGESLASVEASQATGACAAADTSTITMSWTATDGVTSYNVYGRSTGAELFIANVPVFVSQPLPSATISFTDDNSITPTGALPTWESSSAVTSISAYHNETIAGGVQVTGIVTPVTRQYSTACTGGSLVHSTTYYYRITALSAMGESLASTETSKATGACGAVDTSTVTVTWGLIAGAISYNVYGRTTGAEQLIANVSGRDTLSYTDTGSISPSGALPTVNTTARSRIGASRLIAANKPTTPVDCAAGTINATITQLLEAGIFTCATSQQLVLPSAKGASGIVQSICNGATGGSVGCAVGDYFQILLAENHASNTFTLAANGDASETIFGIATITNGNRIWTCRITAITAGSEALTCY